MKTGQELDRSELERLLRKHQNTLVIVGKGVFAFGLWSVAKVFLSVRLIPEIRNQALLNPDTGELFPELWVYGILAFFSFFILLFRAAVRRGAVAEGLGRRTRLGYVALAVLIAAVDASALIASLLEPEQAYRSVLDGIVSVVVELTSIVTTIELIVSAVRVRKLVRMLGERG